MDIKTLFLQHGAAAWEKQLFLSDLLGDNPPNWSFRMDAGTLSFEDAFTFNVQLLGTVSQQTQTWLWAWANDASSIPASLIEAATQLKTYGEKHNIRLLSRADAIPVEDEQVDGHRLAMIASGVCHANAYYRGPYDGGALFLLIRDENFPQDTRSPIERIATAFPQFIQNVQVFDHRAAFEHYLAWHTLDYETHHKDALTTLTAEQANGATLTATFDDQQRLTALQTTLKEDDAAEDES